MLQAAPVDYYDRHAQAFFARTHAVDIAHLRQPFLACLGPRARVLDAGCGSGRDSRAFLQAGLRVSAFDASAEMARLAQAHTGLSVSHCAFLDYRSAEPFDGVWACASLLHVPRAELAHTLDHLLGLLRPNGVLYASLKLGETERLEHGRYFNDTTPAAFTQLAESLTSARLQRLWVTAGVQDASQQWVNALLRLDVGEGCGPGEARTDPPRFTCAAFKRGGGGGRP